MDNTEMARVLHEKTGIPIPEAALALEKADFDLFDALLLLEKEGKIDPVTKATSTREYVNGYEEIKLNSTSSTPSQKEEKKRRARPVGRFPNPFKHFFTVRKNGKVTLTFPLALLIVISIPLSLPILIAIFVGLSSGCSCSIEKRVRDEEPPSPDTNAD